MGSKIMDRVACVDDADLPSELSTTAPSTPLRGLDGWDTTQRLLTSTWNALEAEHKTLDRLIYKNNSQHKRAVHWRHLKEVQRRHKALARVAAVRTACSVRVLMQSKASSSTARPAQPTRTAVSFTMLRLLLASAHAEKVELVTVTAARHLSALLAQTFFMPFGVTMFSLLSRSYVLHQQLRAELAELFQCAARLRPTLPEVDPRRLADLPRDFSWLQHAPLPSSIGSTRQVPVALVPLEEVVEPPAASQAEDRGDAAHSDELEDLGEPMPMSKPAQPLPQRRPRQEG